MHSIFHATLKLESTGLQNKDNLLELLFSPMCGSVKSILCSVDCFKQTLHYFWVFELFCFFSFFFLTPQAKLLSASLLVIVLLAAEFSLQTMAAWITRN